MSEIKYFGRWDADDVVITDQGLANYISFEPVHVPKTGARYAKNRFHKSNISIVERFMNKVMGSGHKGKKHYHSTGDTTGKGQTVLGIMEETLEIIEKRTKKNPIAVLVSGIVNAAPREEIIAIEYGGARYPKAVECAPQRRIDLTIRIMTQSANHKAFNSKKPIAQALAEELIYASEFSAQSAAIAKKNDSERQADSAR